MINSAFQLYHRVSSKLSSTACKKALILIAAFFVISPVFANPILNNVSSGNVTIKQTPNSTVINQSSQQAIINWNSFNIGANQSTHFQQPTGGVALNRISAAQGASSIYGQLTATGQIILVNPAGIYFGPSAYVNVGSLIATTANISDANFLSGNYHFVEIPGYNGSIINAGTLIAAEHGLLALVGSNVSNSGLIQANLGHVILATGGAFTVTFGADDLVSFTIDANDLNNGGITNTGTLSANGGSILVSAQTASGVLDDVINMQGVVQAQSVDKQNGDIIISGDPNAGVVNVAANIDASGKQAGQTGGNVSITGYNILLNSNTTIDTSGDLGGGNIFVGGDAHGTGPLPNANATVVAPTATLLANAITNGNGGNIVVWSDQMTKVYGDLSAQGGSLGGNGGSIETSSGNYLEVGSAAVNLSAPNGTVGTWLLDPFDVTITSSVTSNGSFSGGNPNTFTPSAETGNVLNTDIDTNLATANVVITTNPTNNADNAGNITVAAPIVWSSGNTLTLQANSTNNQGAGYGSITINANGASNMISATGGGSLLLNAAAGDVYINGLVSLTGGATASQSTLTVNALSTAFNFGTLTTAGTQTYNSSATVGYGVILTSTLGDVIFPSPTSTISEVGYYLEINNAGANSLIASSISGTLGLAKAGLGTLTLSGSNSYTGSTAINTNGGVLNLTNASALGNSSMITVTGGTATLSIAFNGGTLSSTGQMRIDGSGFNNEGALYDASTSGVDVLSNPINLLYTSTINSANPTVNGLTLAGGITNSGFLLTLIGAGNIAESGAITGTAGLTMNNTGTLKLTGTNTYSGATTINSGNVTLSGANGTAVDTTFTVNPGATLTLDNTAANNSTRLSSANALTLNSATLVFNGSSSTNAAESLGTLVLASGASTVSVNPEGGGTTELTFASINPSADATVLFSGTGLGGNPGTSTTNIFFTSPTNLNLTGGGTGYGTTTISIVPYALGYSSATNDSFVTYDVDNNGDVNGIRPLASNEYANALVSGANVELTTGSTTATTVSINSLLFNGGTLSFTTNNTTLTDTSGLLGATSASGTLSNSATGSTLQFGSSGTATGFIFGAGALTIPVILATSGGLADSNSALVTLSGANTYTGGTTINEGATISISADTDLGPVPGTQTAGQITFNGGTLDTSFSTLSTNRGIAFGLGGGTIAPSTALTYSGIIAGSGGLTLAGSAGLTLSGANTYAGATIINNNVLTISADNNLGTAPSSATAGQIILNGSTLDATASFTLNANRGMTLAGSNDTFIVPTGVTLSYGGIIAGSGGITMNGTGTGTLSISGSNTYTGNIIVSSGKLLAGAASALGTSSGGTISVSSGAELGLSLGNNVLSNTNTITLNGSGISNAGALSESGSSSDTVTNAIILGSATTIGSTSGGLTLTGGITNGGFLTTFSGTGSITQSTTPITGTGGLTMSGTGTLTLYSGNTYTGATTINSGTVSAGLLQVTGNASSLGNASSAITLGSSSGGTLLSTGTNDTLNRNITIGGTGGGTLETSAGLTLSNITITTATNDPLTLDTNGASMTEASTALITGAGNVSINGNNTVTFDVSNTYTGSTNINSGTLALGLTNAIPSSNAVVMSAGGILNMAGFSDTISSLAGTGGTVESTSGTPTLTTGNSAASTTFSGVIENAINVTKVGNDTFTLSGSNTYSGATTLTLGTLLAGAANVLSPNSSITIANASGASLNLSGFSQTIASLAGGGSSGGTIPLNVAILTISNATAGSNTTFAGVISGGGGITIDLTGTSSPTLTLTGLNTYSGATTIQAGTLAVGVSNAIKNTSAVTMSGGTLSIGNGFSDTIASLTTTAGAVTLGNSSSSLTTGSLSGSGATVTLNGGSFTSNDSGTDTFSGTIGGSSTDTGTFVMGGTGTLTLSGSVQGANAGSGVGLTVNGGGTLALPSTFTGSYGGAVSLSNGKLSIASTSGLGSSSGVTVTSGGELDIAGVTVSGTQPISIAGNGFATTNNGAIYETTGTGGLGGAITLAANASIGAANGTTLNLSGAISDGGGSNYYKAILNNNNTTGTISATSFTGSTSNAASILAINAGSAAFSGAVTADSLTTTANDTNITLGGGGTITNAVSFLNTGTTTLGGALTFTGGLTSTAGTTILNAGTLSATGSNNITLGTTTVAGNSTVKVVTGTLTLGATDSSVAGTNSLTAEATGVGSLVLGIIGGTNPLNTFTAEAGISTSGTPININNNINTSGTNNGITIETYNNNIAINNGSLNAPGGTVILGFTNGSGTSLITETNGDTGAITANALGTTGNAGVVTLNNANNNVSTLAGGGSSFSYVNASGTLTIGTVGSVNGISVSSTASVTNDNGSITVNQPIPASTGEQVLLTAEGNGTNNTLTINANLGTASANNTIGLVADNMVISSNVYGGTVDISPYLVTTPINFGGSSASSSGTLGLTNTELGLINSLDNPAQISSGTGGTGTAGVLTIGNLNVTGKYTFNVGNTININNPIGNTTAPGQLFFEATNGISLGANVTSTGEITFDSPITLTAGSTVTGVGSVSIDYLGAISGNGSGTVNFTSNGTGLVTFGSTVNVGTITNPVNLIASGSSILLQGAITTAGTQDYESAVRISNANLALNSSATNGSITFNSTIDNQNVAEDSLSINTGSGPILLDGSIGSGSNGALNFLTLTSTGSVTLGTAGTSSTVKAFSVNSNASNGTTTLDTSSITTSNVQTYNNVVLGSTSPLTTSLISTTGSGTLTINGTTNLGSNTLSLSGSNQVNAIDGVISGSGSFTYAGGSSSKLTLAAANTYTGATTISGGILSLSNANGLGSSGDESSSINISGTATLNLNFAGATFGNTDPLTLNGAGVLTNGALTFSNLGIIVNNAITLGANASIGVTGGTGTATLSGIINDGGNGYSLTTTGSANTGITLSGVNTYSGGTLIAAGGVILTATTSNTALGSGNISIGNNSELILNGVTIANNIISVQGTGNGLAGAIIGANSTINGNVTLAGNTSIGVTAGEPTIINGIISDGGHGYTLTERSGSNAGTLVLTGANTYAGSTTLNPGLILQISADDNLGAAPSQATAGQLSLSSGTLDVTSGFILNPNRGIALSGGGSTIEVDAGTLTYGGIIAGTNGLIVSSAGTGTLSLGSANTYTGGTTISSGTVVAPLLLVTGGASSLGNDSSAITLGGSSTGTLISTGTNDTLNRSITIGGHGGGVLQANAGLTLANMTITTANGDPITFNANGSSLSEASTAVITGAGNVSVSGNNTVTFGGTNTYTGTSTVNNGVILAVTNVAGLSSGSGASAGAISVMNGGELDLNLGGATLANQKTLTLNGAGTNAALYEVGSAADTVSNAITLGSASSIGAAAGRTLNLTGGITNAGFLTTFLGSGNINQSNTAITGTGGVTMSGTGTLTLGATNTYTGITTINSGATLSISADAGLGTAPALFTAAQLTIQGGTLDATSTFALNSKRGITLGTGGATINVAPTDTLTYGGVIAGSNPLTVTSAGTGILALSGANTYSGTTMIDGGSLQAMAASTFSPNSAINFANVSGATLNLNGNNESIASLAGGGTSGGNVALGVGTLTIANAINGSNTSYAGSISGTGGLTINLTGTSSPTQTLTGVNTYTGATTIQAGTLVIGVNNAINSGSAVAISGGALSLGNGFTDTLASLTTTGGAVILGNGSALTTDALSGSAATITLGGGSFITQDSGTDTFSGTIGSSNTDTGTFTMAGTGTETVSGVIQGSGVAVDVNSGTLTLTDANTYGNGTSVASGGLLIAGNNTALGTALTTVNAGGALQINNGFNLGNALSIAGTGTSGNGALIGVGVSGGTASGAINLAGNTTIGAVNAGDLLVLTGNTVTGNGHTLNLAGAGAVKLGDTLSGVNALVSNVNTIISTNLTTTAAQTYNNPITLATTATLTGVNLDLANTVTGGSNALTLSDTGTSTLGGTVSGLASLQTNAVNIDASVTTAGAQTYGAASLGANVTLTGVGIDLAGAVTGNMHSLALADTGISTLGGTISGLSSLQTNAVNIDANVTTTSTQSYGAVSVGANATLNGVGITLGNINDSNASGTDSLVVNAGSGALSFGAVGNVKPLQNFTASNTGVSNNLTVSNNVAVANDVSFTTGAALSETGSALIDATALTTSSASGTTLNNNNDIAVFNATNTSSNAIALTNVAPLSIAGIAQAGGNLTINNTGAISQTGAISVSGTSSFNAHANVINLADTSNNFTGAVSLDNTGANNVTLNNTNALLTIGASSVGSGTTNITNTGALTLSGQINSTNGNVNLATNEVGGVASILTINNSIITAGGAINLTADTNMPINADALFLNNATLNTSPGTGGTLTLGGGVVTNNLTFVIGTGDVTLQGNGNNLTLAGTNDYPVSIAFSVPGMINLSGTVSSTTGSVSFLTPVTLTSNAAVDAVNNITFDNGVIGDKNLTLTSTSSGSDYTLDGNLVLNNITITPTAGTLNNTLVLGTNGTQNWMINGTDTGAITGVTGVTGTFSYNTIQNLNGGNGQNNFVLNGGSVSGAINGGSSGANTITVASGNNTWYITNANGGTVNGVANGFSNIQNLNGGTGSNTFNIQGGTLTGSINGGTGTNNTLVADNVYNNWTLAGMNAGTVNGVTSGFSNIQNLTGGNAGNTFTFGNGAVVTGLIDGGSLATTNSLNFVAYTSPLKANLASNVFSGNITSGPAMIVSSYMNINNLVGNSSTANLNIISLPSKNNLVTITGVNAGYINDPLTFSGFSILSAVPGNTNTVIFNVPYTYTPGSNVVLVNGVPMTFQNFYFNNPDQTSTETDNDNNVSSIIQQPTINAGSNYQSVYLSEGTTSNMNEMMSQISAAYDVDVNRVKINPYCDFSDAGATY